MRKLFMTIVVAIFGMVLLTGCSAKQHAINQLENLSIDLRDKSAYYSIDQWEKAIDRFSKIRKKMAKYDYTPEERKRIGVLEGQCARYMAQGAKDGLLNGVQRVSGELQGIIEGILGRDWK